MSRVRRHLRELRYAVRALRVDDLEPYLELIRSTMAAIDASDESLPTLPTWRPSCANKNRPVSCAPRSRQLADVAGGTRRGRRADRAPAAVVGSVARWPERRVLV